MIQTLERRQLCAATIQLSGGLLRVIGSDAYRDDVTVTFIAQNIEASVTEDRIAVDVIQRTAGGATVSTQTKLYKAADVAGIKVDTCGGDDKVLITGDANTDLSLVLATLLGGAGNDKLSVGSGGLARLIDGGAGDDEISDAQTLLGGEGNDRLAGRSSQGLEARPYSESFFGGAGNDTLVGNGGNDLLDGGTGNDTLSQTASFNSYSDRSTLLGGDGNDVIRFEGAAARVDGGKGSDQITVFDALGGEDPADVGDIPELFNRGDVHGGPGPDVIRLERVALRPGEHVRVFGDAGDDKLYGSNQADVLYGGDGNDAVYGYDGNDTLDGGTGRDSLFGGLGLDSLFATDNALDFLNGGADGVSDTFVKDLLDRVTG